jgi:hypothetical protein
MKICFALLALAAIITTGCKTDIESDMSANDKYMNVQGNIPDDVVPPITNLPPIKIWPPVE